MRKKSLFDHVIIELEHGLRTCFVKPPAGPRPYPAAGEQQTVLDESEQSHVTGLMRINNAGEVAAQGLYRGQAVTARNKKVKQDMKVAAEEENEHLNWCQTRLQELDATSSILDPVWYWGSFAIGVTAGAVGDKWSLGFVEETEKQVTEHLQDHLQKLPPQDKRSHKILQQMKQDEMQHAINAHKAGAAELPAAVKSLMTLTSKIMTRSAYRL